MNPSSKLPESGTALSSSETLIASLVYLLSRYAIERDRRLLCCITRHFALLTQHPDLRSAVLQQTFKGLWAQWTAQLQAMNTADPTLH